MDQTAEYIKQRLSLRDPLKESLDILATLTDELLLKKEVDLQSELAKVTAKYPLCTDFEREFPSICYSIATGVGKTRLMGACIAYLHLKKGIRNFFILAPNITIYEKLIEDFSVPTNPKYVFQGIAEFVHNRPVIVTGDNYTQQGAVPGNLIEDKSVRINIFNISKFNKESKAGKSGATPRIKRLSEYLGESYWQYLMGLDDLVVLMDEAHRYHADASRNAINELKPVLGIELTATPKDEDGENFKNVVYEYTLARALADGKYVKNPAIAKRKDFRPQGMAPLEIEHMKLQDAVSLHLDTKNELEIFARNNRVKQVKPFILVVCRDIAHAKEVFTYVTSDEFCSGEYKDKVLQIDSSTRDEDEVERQFVRLDNEDNKIEIVIHVNMLKEGWDVTNLYTIAPLRTAQAPILIEQTIGRGLRLPYNGERTGDEKVDRLTVLAHENFQDVIDAAQDPNSILNKMSIMDIPDEVLQAQSIVVTVRANVQESLRKEEDALPTIKNADERQMAKNIIDAKRFIIEAVNNPAVVQKTTGLSDYVKPEIEKVVLADAMSRLESSHPMFKDAIAIQLKEVYKNILAQITTNIIEIPRIDVVQGDVSVTYENFDLDTSEGFRFRPLNEEIVVVEITGEQRRATVGVYQESLSAINGPSLIVSELERFPEVDYDRMAELLYKLANQAIAAVDEGLDDKSKLPLVIRQYHKLIAGKIYEQIKNGHVRVAEDDHIESRVLPFMRIESWNFVMLATEGLKNFKATIAPVSQVPKYVYNGFTKACHAEYKFDSNTEKVFAEVLESDDKVKKWLRPAPNQFRIYWSNNSRQYYPDFVAETDDSIYLIETKAQDQLKVAEVVDKKKAALRYCTIASDFITKNGGKPWRYLLIPHDEVTRTSSFDYFASHFEQKAG